MTALMARCSEGKDIFLFERYACRVMGEATCERCFIPMGLVCDL